jgi:hypothetical protein
MNLLRPAALACLVGAFTPCAALASPAPSAAAYSAHPAASHHRNRPGPVDTRPRRFKGHAARTVRGPPAQTINIKSKVRQPTSAAAKTADVAATATAVKAAASVSTTPASSTSASTTAKSAIMTVASAAPPPATPS